MGSPWYPQQGYTHQEFVQYPPVSGASQFQESPRVVDQPPKIITVLASDRSKSGLILKKHNACLFCGELQKQLFAHYRAKHSSEKDVKALELLNKQQDSKDRLLRELKLKGNYNHNVAVMKRGYGSLIVSRCSMVNADPSKYVGCPNCFQFLSEANFARHTHKCQNKDFSNPATLQQARAAKDACTATDITDTKAFEILGELKKDKLGEIVRSDKTLRTYIQYRQQTESFK